MRDGFQNMVNLSHIVSKHCSQKNHLNAAHDMSMVMCNKDIQSQIIQQTEKVLSKKRMEAKVLREYLERIIDVLRFQCAESLAHRGSHEKNFYTHADECPMYQKALENF